MIRALAITPEGKPIIVLGITRGNVERLKRGQPIRVTGASINCPEVESVLVFYGENESVIAEDLREAGLITAETAIREGA